jgi:hypothetical protein
VEKLGGFPAGFQKIAAKKASSVRKPAFLKTKGCFGDLPSVFSRIGTVKKYFSGLCMRRFLPERPPKEDILVAPVSGR